MIVAMFFSIGAFTWANRFHRWPFDSTQDTRTDRIGISRNPVFLRSPLILQTIFFNLRFLTQPMSGMQRYAQELLTALDTLISRQPGRLEGVRFVGLRPPGAHRKVAWNSIEQRVIGYGVGHLWEQTALARVAQSGILVSLGGTGPLLHRRHVLALHDANVFANPKFFSRRYSLLHRTLRPRLARRAERLITISEFSRGELSRYCGVGKDDFTIIGDSAEHILGVGKDTSILEKNDLKPGGYALCVGNQSPNKNIALACVAFGMARSRDMKLAIAGGSAPALRAAHVQEADWQVPLGRVSDEALRTLYENAAVFIFPSIYEGFGVPPLEAMALGCPVVASDRTAMPEILGDSAVLFSCNDTQACAGALRTVLAMNDVERAEMIAKGRATAQSHSWARSADTLASLLEGML